MNHVSRFLSLIAVSLLVAGAAAAETQKYRAHRLPVVSMRRLAAAPAAEALPRETRNRERRPGYGALPAGTLTEPAPPRTLATIAPPAVARGFASDSHRNLTPADAAGAAGPSHVVSVTNAGIAVHNRDGARLMHVPLHQFWSTTGVVAEFYDPRIAYDARADRWVTVAVHEGAGVMLAVTSTGDPSGTWTRYRIPVEEGCDFMRLALARNDVIINTLLGDTAGMMLFTPKAEFYAGKESFELVSFNVSSTYAIPVNGPDSETAYIASVAENGITLTELPSGSVSHYAMPVPSYQTLDFINAPQPNGGRFLDMGYDEIYSAELHGETVHLARMIAQYDSGQFRSSIVWMKIAPRQQKMLQWGLISDPLGRTYYSYPSLAVNRDGAMLLAYSAVSATRFASAEFIYVDKNGNVSTPRVMKDGEAAATTSPRWGDYTSTVLDPNRRDFWSVQVYATSTGTWGTWWGNVKLPSGRQRSVGRR